MRLLHGLGGTAGGVRSDFVERVLRVRTRGPSAGVSGRVRRSGAVLVDADEASCELALVADDGFDAGVRRS